MNFKIGDIFEVQLNENLKGYVQYIANDPEQLNSDVVRVFTKRYRSNEQVDVDNLPKTEVEFYSHVADVEVGLKDGSWKKVGYSRMLVI